MLWLIGNNPRLSGADSYYHLRHAEAVMQNYPFIERYDKMSYFPTTERGLNQGFYDVLVATLSKLTLVGAPVDYDETPTVSDAAATALAKSRPWVLQRMMIRRRAFSRLTELGPDP